MMHIVLAHGVLGFDAILGVEYFNGVAKYLKGLRGVTAVTTTKVDAIGSVVTRAPQLAERIPAAANKSVYIFAHSMGGLDARYAIGKNLSGITAKVAALVTIGTPHLGSPVADQLANGQFLQIDQEALRDLTSAVAGHQTAETKVPTFCVAGDLTAKGARASPFFTALAHGASIEEPNDGVVTVRSATAVGTKIGDTWPLDHAGLIGWPPHLVLDSSFPFVRQMHLARYRMLVEFFQRQKLA